MNSILNGSYNLKNNMEAVLHALEMKFLSIYIIFHPV